jgi:hypothetical protein
MLTREQLAALGLEMLATQRRYFNPATRTQAVLEESKAIERKFRLECERIIQGPSLFDREDRP